MHTECDVPGGEAHYNWLSVTPTSAFPGTPSTSTLSADTSYTSNSSPETQVPSFSTSDASSSPPSSTVSHSSLVYKTVLF